MSQFQQHYVAWEKLSWSIEFLVDYDFAGRNANSETVRLWLTMQTNDHSWFIDASRGLKSVQQKLNSSHFGNIKQEKLLEKW